MQPSCGGGGLGQGYRQIPIESLEDGYNPED